MNESSESSALYYDRKTLQNDYCACVRQIRKDFSLRLTTERHHKIIKCVISYQAKLVLKFYFTFQYIDKLKSFK